MFESRVGHFTFEYRPDFSGQLLVKFSVLALKLLNLDDVAIAVIAADIRPIHIDFLSGSSGPLEFQLVALVLNAYGTENLHRESMAFSGRGWLSLINRVSVAKFLCLFELFDGASSKLFSQARRESALSTFSLPLKLRFLCFKLYTIEPTLRSTAVETNLVSRSVSGDIYTFFQCFRYGRFNPLSINSLEERYGVAISKREAFFLKVAIAAKTIGAPNVPAVLIIAASTGAPTVSNVTSLAVNGIIIPHWCNFTP